MGTQNQQRVEPTGKEPRQPEPPPGAPRQRLVQPCNFRSAGRLSNEIARSLTGTNEIFARYFGAALDAQLGAGVKVKLLSLDRLPIKDHIAAIPAATFIAPFSIASIPCTAIVECDIDLVFPIIDLLLGGSGTAVKGSGELSEIEEEVMQDLTGMMARQIENAWGLPSMSLEGGGRIKSTGLPAHCPPNEKITVIKFEMEIAGLTGWFQLVFPTAFITTQAKQMNVEQPRKKEKLRYFPTASLRERILDCDIVVSADLTSIRVPVKELIKLQTGCVLKLRTPVKTPGMLTVGGREIFEVLPVRNGKQKAAQVGRAVQMTHWGKE